MAQEHKALMTCLVLASHMRSSPSFALNGSLKIALRHCPIVIDAEGFTVRDHYLTVNNPGY